jgi:hypothetical protein
LNTLSLRREASYTLFDMILILKLVLALGAGFAILALL